MPSPESRSHRRAVLVMDYRDDSGSPPVAGNYTSNRNLSLDAARSKSDLDRDIVNCFKRLCFISNTDSRTSHLVTLNRTACVSLARALYHAADLARFSDPLPLPKTNQNGTVTSSSRLATSRYPSLSPWRLVFPPDSILYSYRHMAFPSPRNSSHNRPFPSFL
jgi:hypothetical protein